MHIKRCIVSHLKIHITNLEPYLHSIYTLPTITNQLICLCSRTPNLSYDGYPEWDEPFNWNMHGLHESFSTFPLVLLHFILCLEDYKTLGSSGTIQWLWLELVYRFASFCGWSWIMVSSLLIRLMVPYGYALVTLLL